MIKNKCVNYLSIPLLIILTSSLTSLSAIPIDLNANNANGPNSPNYIEIKLPVKITSMDDLINWIKNAMKSMASRIDITLASGNGSTLPQNENLMLNKEQNLSDDKSEKTYDTQSTIYSARNNILDKQSSWLKNINELYSSTINREAYLPLFISEVEKNHEQVNTLLPYTLTSNLENKEMSTLGKLMKKNRRDKNELNDTNLSNFNNSKTKVIEASNSIEQTSDVESIPFAIPFEAYITITKESSSDSHLQSLNTNYASKYQNLLPTQSPVYLNQKTVNMTSAKVQTSPTATKKDKPRKSQIVTLGKLVKSLGLTALTGKRKVHQDTKTSPAGIKSQNYGEYNRQSTNNFENVLLRATRNESSQRQEFDDDGDVSNEGGNVNVKDEAMSNEEDDDDYEENEGSLGSITDLLPLAIPILEDLSDPESDVNLIGLLQAGIPLIQGLSEPDEDGNGGANDIIKMIVPIVTKIVGGPTGEGSDIGALVGPLFGLFAPFIGPVLAPLIGPLIRTISNPPTEGSSLATLVAAISGPLSQPQQPSGMSPLSIVIAGTAAALLKEIKPGAPGGSDLGAFIAAILSGVITGTSAGLSGGSSESPGSMSGHYSDRPPQASLASINANFNDRPLRPSPNNLYTIRRPNNGANTVNIGSTLPPSAAPVSVSPVNHKYSRPTSPSHLSHSPIYVNGPVSAAATNGNGGSSYLPYASTSVPAHSVNPLTLIGTSIQDIVGAGLQVVSSLVNAVFGIFGASSSEPSPSYGPPAASYNSHTSGQVILNNGKLN